MPVCLTTSPSSIGPLVFHRLPDGVGGFVEEDFVGHGGEVRRVENWTAPKGRHRLAGRRQPPEIVGYQSTIQAPEGRHRTAWMTGTMSPLQGFAIECAIADRGLTPPGYS